MQRKRYTRQQVKKHIDGECFVCKENKYELLDAHRIIEGGTYDYRNVVILCASCHRRVHCGEIKFDKKYNSTNGLLLHWWLSDREYWTPVLT